MTRTLGTALIAGMMAFGLAACDTPSKTDSMSGSSSTMSTTGSAQAPSTNAGQGSWNSGATGATGVNSASGTTSNNEPVTNSPTGR